MSRKIFKVKTNYLLMDLLIFELPRTFPIAKNNCLQHYDNVFNKKYLLDNYNHLRHNKNSVRGIESKEF